MFFLYNYGQSIHPSFVFSYADGLLDKTRKQKRNWGDGKEKYHSFSTWWLSIFHSTCMWVTLSAWFWEPKSTDFFLSHDESKLCLSFIIVATPTVKLYYSCVKTSSNLKIGHEAAKKPTHSVIFNAILERKNSIDALWMQKSFCQMCREKVVKTQGIFE